MSRLLKYRPSRSTVIALVALFVAIGGSATAATVITGRQIRNNSVTSSDIKNGSLLSRDFRRGQLPRGRTGATGATGLRGATGASGAAGRDGFGLLTYEIAEAPFADGAPLDRVEVTCPDGTYPTGGDAYTLKQSDDSLVTGTVVDQGLLFTQQAPVLPVGWGATIVNNSGSAVNAFVEAVCANASNVVLGKNKTRRRVK